ncbi:MAG TPA: GspH/FimT family protein, partial [Usitatibacteraceae bacterium]|nr:GspH/FimT family protein [Usitatibacteraceae bacterium]
LTSYSTNLVASIQVARSEAIKRNTVVTLCASTDGAACADDWGNGWIVLSGASVLQREQALPSGWRVTEKDGIGSLTFQPTGVGVTQAEFTFCRATPAGSQERVLTVSATGTASVRKTTTGTCS